MIGNGIGNGSSKMMLSVLQLRDIFKRDSGHCGAMVSLWDLVLPECLAENVQGVENSIRRVLSFVVLCV